MKIAWLQDLDPMVVSGGAQLNDRRMIERGFARGHHIQVVLQSNMEDLALGFDLVIVSNAVAFKHEIFEDLAKRSIPYLFFVHDYGPWLCKWRLFYSMEERCQKLCFLRDRWRGVLLAAKGFVWLSPLHRDAWLFAYPELKESEFTLVPSAVDETKFKDLGRPRAGALCVNSLLRFKGVNNVLRWAQEHPNIQVDHYGAADDEYALPPNLKDLGPVPYPQMNELMNKYEIFLHLPDNPMPYDRTVAEAYLAGCRVIGNANVGALSWEAFRSGGRDKVRELCRQAPEDFWRFIER